MTSASGYGGRITARLSSQATIRRRRAKHVSLRATQMPWLLAVLSLLTRTSLSDSGETRYLMYRTQEPSSAVVKSATRTTQFLRVSRSELDAIFVPPSSKTAEECFALATSADGGGCDGTS